MMESVLNIQEFNILKRENKQLKKELEKEKNKNKKLRGIINEIKVSCIETIKENIIMI